MIVLKGVASMAFWSVDERVPVPQSVEVETARMASIDTLFFS
jgi:hypothetical protein